MERTSGIRDLKQLFVRKHGGLRKTFPQESDFMAALPEDAEFSNPGRLRPAKLGGEDEEGEDSDSPKRPSRRANTPRHETLYGAVKAVDEDRPECDTETNYMDMQLVQRERNHTSRMKSEASGDSSDFKRTQSHQLNKEGASPSLYLSFQKEKVCNLD
jgi:hypothetical protein